jgi:hypothetical protein
MNTKNFKAFENMDFLLSREARPIRIMSEYIEPEKRLSEHGINNTIVFFGSARSKPDSGPDIIRDSYKAADEMAFRLAKMSDEIQKETGEKYYICTGGGGGIMEAANLGASRAGEKTIGLNIDLPFEQNPNPYITPELNFEFHYFFMRKLWFLYQAKAILLYPGGFGTMDELFETLTLIQTKKLEKANIPVLLYGKKFWNELVNFKKFIEYGLISENDLDLFHIFDDIEDGISYLKPRLVSLLKNSHSLTEKRFPI